MSDNIDIPVNASGEDGINRIVSSIDRLYAGLEKLGQVSGLGRLEQQMKEMQASMSNGFIEIAALAKNGEARIIAEQEKGLTRRQQQVAAWEAKQVVSANRFHDKMVEIEAAGENRRAAALRAVMERRDIETFNAATSATQRLVEIQQRRDTELHSSAASAAQRLVEIQQRRDTELFSQAQNAARRQAEIQQRRDMDEYREAQTAASRIIEIAQRRDTELHSMRQREARDAAAAAEKQRTLNTSFLTASPVSQIQTARQAQTYSSLGGDAAQRYGSAAAGADIRALEEAHKRLQAVIPGSTRATQEHGHAMNEAHSLARGLAGSLGGLWLTYGSVAPLLAGAAIAASLKNIVTAGKEVEQQLNFVFALSEERKGVNLDQFLTITDSALRSVTESANAMRALAQNGLEASQSLQVLPSILDLATVGEMQVGQAAIAATGAVSAFGLSFAEAGRVSDIFAKTAATSNTSVLAITESMKQASTVAGLFKVTIEETAGMLGLLAKINITGGAAGTSMTNMLTGLYEPTEKGKRALRELGVETKTATGAIKPFTQTMEETKMALSGFNDSAKVDILGSIFTVRGVKSALLALDNLDELKKKTYEASTAAGYMRGVVTQLEDSTDGAFKRLAVTVENTFVRAFADAAPYVQQLGLHLSDAFKDGGIQTGIANFSVNIARMTGFLLDNLSAVLALGAAYIGFRALGPVILLIQGATAASAASTVAATAATAASIAHTSAISAGAATLGTYTLMVETQTAATVAATAASSAWSAVLLPFLGAMAIAVAGAAALWLLFRDNTDEADKANVKIGNSLHVVTEQLDKEIARLKESNALWDARSGKFLAQGTVTPEVLDQAGIEVKKIENRIRKSGGDPNAARNYTTEIDAGTGMSAVSAGYHELSDALIKADDNLAKLAEQQRRYNEIVKPKTAIEQTQQATAQLKKDLELFARRSSEINSKNQLYQPNEEIRSTYRKAGGLVNELLDPTKRLTNAEDEKVRIDALRVSLKQLNDEVNKQQASRAEKPTKPPGANAELNVDLKRLHLAVELQKIQSDSNIATARQQNKRGELGDLSLINIELKEKLALDRKEIEVAEKKYAVASAADKIAKAQQFINDKSKAEARVTAHTTEAQEAERLVLKRMSDDAIDFEIRTLEAKGQHVAAYLKDYEATYGPTLVGIENDIANSQSQNQIEALERYKAYLGQMKEAGQNDANFTQIQEEMGRGFDALSLKVQQLSNTASGGAGLTTIFTSAMAAQKAYAAALPKLIVQQRELQGLASRSGSTRDQKAADDAMARIRAGAASARNIWLGVADAIGQSMSKAFGKAGSALGQLLQSTVAYGIKRQEIDDDYARADKSDPAKLAEAQMEASRNQTSAQVAAYAEMAGAAKGFFEEGSKGYQTLANAEKAYRIVELAMTAQAMYQKLFAVQVTTAAKVGGIEMEIAAEKIKMLDAEVNTAEIIALGMAEGQTAALVGVANQAKGEPYSAWARMAAMAAAMAALGFMVSGGGGGGGGKTASEVQATQNTGTVFGDVGIRQDDGTLLFKEQSKSLMHSLALLEEHSGGLIPINQGMLAALRNIESAMGGLANQILRTPGLVTEDGSIDGQVRIGKATDPISKIMTQVTRGLGGPILGDKIAQFVNNLWGKTTQKVVDSGARFTGSIRDLQQGVGYTQYSSVDTTKSSGFGLIKNTKNREVVSGLGMELASQFGMVFSDLEEALKVAAQGLGIGADQVTRALDSLSISSSVSLKGLSGDALNQALSAMLSEVMDKMAGASFPELEAFRKVGEGFSETVIRLADDYASINRVMESMGSTFGSIGVESLAAREGLLTMAGGLDKFISKADYFVENFLTKEERLAPIQKYVSSTLKPFEVGGNEIDTMEEYKNLVKKFAGDTSLDGMKAYTTLMDLAPAFKEVADAAKESADALEEAMDRINDETKDLRDQFEDLTFTDQSKLDKQRGALLSEENKLLFDQIVLAKKSKTAQEALAETMKAVKDETTSLRDQYEELTFTDQSKLDKQRGALLSEENKLLFDQIQLAKRAVEAKDVLSEAYEREKNNAEQMIERLKTLGASWKKFRDGLLLSEKSPLTPKQKYDEAQRQFDANLIKARSGDVGAQDQFEELANALLDASAVANASGDLYTADFQKVVTATEEAMQWASQQVDVAKASLTALENQVGGLIKVESAVLSVSAAINELAFSLGAKGEEAAQRAREATITGLFHDLLNRDPKAEGMAFWTNALKEGQTVQQVVTGITGGTEYQNRQNGQNPYASADPGMQSGTGYMSKQSAYEAPSRPAYEGPTAEQMERLLQEIADLRREAQEQATNAMVAEAAVASAAAERMAEAVVEAAIIDHWKEKSEAKLV